MNDTDRELLELAAKAAGFVDIDFIAYDGYANVYDNAGRHAAWNPLEDDGDAFRLMCIFDFRVFFFRKHVDVVDWARSENVIAEYFSSNNPQTKPAALRRAIVLAAAEIGKGIK